MASIYDAPAATALKLIKAKGLQLTISKRGGDAVFDPVTGGFTTAGADVTGTLDCVVLPYSGSTIRALADGSVTADNNYLQDFTEGRLRKLLAAASSAPFEPKAGHVVSGFESSVWEVIGCTPLNPAGTPIIYTMAIRRK
jgi:hypothetical protein